MYLSFLSRLRRPLFPIGKLLQSFSSRVAIHRSRLRSLQHAQQLINIPSTNNDINHPHERCSPDQPIKHIRPNRLETRCSVYDSLRHTRGHLETPRDDRCQQLLDRRVESCLPMPRSHVKCIERRRPFGHQSSFLQMRQRHRHLLDEQITTQ